MKDQIRIRNERYGIDFNLNFVLFTYFPFIGWVYAFIFKNHEAFIMHHAKQAFILAVFFTAVPIVIMFSAVFIPISYRSIRLTFMVLVYLSHLIYFVLCAIGLLKMIKNVLFEFPIVMKFARRLNV